MEKKWYNCKLKYRKTDENGVQNLVTESYLVDGVSFSDAEARINEEMKAYISVDFKVVNIQATNYSEVVGGAETGLWFKSKISLIAFDEESGKEKKQNIYILVEAEDAKQASDTFDTKSEAVNRAQHIAENKGTKVIEHRKDE